MRKYICFVFVVTVLMFGSCGSTTTVTSTEQHHVSDMMNRIDSLISSRSVIRQDSAWRESVMRQFQSIREKSDTSRTTVVDTAGNVIREKIIINNVRETTSERERLEREVLMHRMEKMDSTMSKMIDHQKHTDSLLQAKQTVKEVPAKLSWWQQTRLHLANIMLYLALGYAIWWIFQKKTWWLSLITKVFR